MHKFTEVQAMAQNPDCPFEGYQLCKLMYTYHSSLYFHFQ